MGTPGNYRELQGMRNIPKKTIPPRPAAGEGRMMVQTPVVELLKANGCTPETFASLVRSRRVGGAMREDRYDTTRPSGGAEDAFPVPEGFPVMRGNITWRRAGHWCLDVTMAQIGPGIIFHGTYSSTAASLRIQGESVAETVIVTLIGKPLTSLVDHPFFRDPRINITAINNYSGVGAGGEDRPPSIEIMLDVPKAEHSDAPASWDRLE